LTGKYSPVGHDVGGGKTQLVVFFKHGLAQVDVVKSLEFGSDSAVLLGEFSRV